MAVERMGVGEAAATNLALVMHELATNSMKYGALSSQTGTLDVSTQSSGDTINLIWMERGGPTVEAPPEESGYGSKLLRRSVTRQLHGTIDYDWSERGLIVTLGLDRAMLAK